MDRNSTLSDYFEIIFLRYFEIESTPGGDAVKSVVRTTKDLE